jgi:DNA primase
MLQADSIRHRFDIVRVVGNYVRLTRSGRNYRGVSPFGNDTTGSLFVFPGSQTFKDFASGMQGDVFSFVMLKEGVSFQEAVSRLAAQAGLKDVADNTNAQPIQPERRFTTSAFASIAARAAPIAPEDFAERHDEYIAKIQGLAE